MLIAPAVVGMSALSGQENPLRYLIAAAAVAAIAVAVTISIRRGMVLETEDEEQAGAPGDRTAGTGHDHAPGGDAPRR